MFQRGIRGAITIEANNEQCVRSGVKEIISEIKKQNSFKDEDISYVIFTLTGDIDCVYPAKIAREEFLDWKYVPMLCTNELRIENSISKCLRILIVINTNLEQNRIKHVYLKGAAELRKDLV
ncbi:MAG: chorismate mutase [Candidatus Gastranaerophilales bacterium]|nr:chorismate mutase [Candidatus Gastranaerophilales bacterium]